jgi:hypothetical protein
MIFRPTGNIHPTAPEWKVQSSFQCWPQATAEGVSSVSPGIPRPEAAVFPPDSSETFPSPASLTAGFPLRQNFC